MTSKTEARRDSERKAAVRRGARTVPIRTLTKRERDKRHQLEQSDEAWLRFFFPDPPFGFWYAFTPQQQAMIQAIGQAIKGGGDQSIAASRGEGKTQIMRRLSLKYILQGAVSFVALFGATGPDAATSLQAIQNEIEENERIARYYPEVCDPVRALEGVAQKAGTMLVRGRHGRKAFDEHPCDFKWCGNEITMPRIPGSRCSGAIIATRGLDAAVRGLNKKGRRPDVAIIDDPDTEETANSEEQAKKLEARIDRAIAGLGGQQRGVARVMLTTLQNRRCVSYRFTDPQQKPSWQGRRFRFLVAPPTRVDLWDEYIHLRHEDQRLGDMHGRRAHQFLVDRRDEMHAGAIVANPNRFDGTILPDGSQVELSALQHYYNLVAKIGPEAVATEYDNDPPEESGPIESGISAYRVQTQVSGYDRRVVPDSCTQLTQGIDVGKYALHWVVAAWQPDATGFVIDYGVHEVFGVGRKSSDAAIDRAIYRALCERRDVLLANPYCTADGDQVEISQSLVDSGYRTAAVYDFCRGLGLQWRPSKGFGETAGGPVKTTFRMPKASADKRPGDHWFLSKQERGVWLVGMDSDHWKAWIHDRVMTDPDSPGCLKLFGSPSTRPDRMSDDQKGHFSFSKHMTNEIEVEEVVKNKGLVRHFKTKEGSPNHYFDATYMAAVAASMRGVSLVGGKLIAPADVRPKTLAELKAMADGR